MENADDLCPRPPRQPKLSTEPHAAPLYLSSVYECESFEQADTLLGGRELGYVYARDGHPNGDLLADKCRELHGTQRAVVTGSGMGALAALVLSQLAPGDHVVVSNQLYGRTLLLFTAEAVRLGIGCATVDTNDLAAVERAITPRTRLVVAETISNPLLRVADLSRLAELAHAHGALFVADNTLANPALCQPKRFGADWIMESITKMMNGHSDVILGLLCGPADRWQRVPMVVSTFGLASAPFDCWLAMRGLGTLALRNERASASALAVARLLSASDRVEDTYYPGLPDHPDHELARRQFGDRFGSMVSFTLLGGTEAARAFVQAARRIPFCPSLGELNTTLSHPESTSHRAMTPEARSALGILGGTIRLSVGIESTEAVCEAVSEGLAALA